MTVAQLKKGSARPEGGREAPALTGVTSAARCRTPGGTFEMGAAR